MRRLSALSLFTLGYFVMAALDTQVAAAPSMMAFLAGGYTLVRPVLAEIDAE